MRGELAGEVAVDLGDVDHGGPLERAWFGDLHALRGDARLDLAFDHHHLAITDLDALELHVAADDQLAAARRRARGNGCVVDFLSRRNGRQRGRGRRRRGRGRRGRPARNVAAHRGGRRGRRGIQRHRRPRQLRIVGARIPGTFVAVETEHR